MDWRAVRFDWNHARAFMVAAQEGSFSAAARALGTTQPTVGRQVGALEKQLGVVLLERTTNRLELTSSGLELVDHVKRMGEAATQVSLAATGHATSIEGEVCITASEAISTFLLPQILTQLRIDHPKIEIEIIAANDTRDLRRREADIAIRNFRPEQPDLISRKVADMEAYLFASPAYLERVGPLDTLEGMSKAEFFAFDRTPVIIDGMRALGLNLSKTQFPIVSSNHIVQWELCKQGAGICFMMADIGAQEPAVQRVCPDIVFPVPIWLVCHRELKTSRRIRLVFDRLAAGLRAS